MDSLIEPVILNETNPVEFFDEIQTTSLTQLHAFVVAIKKAMIEAVQRGSNEVWRDCIYSEELLSKAFGRFFTITDTHICLLDMDAWWEKFDRTTEEIMFLTDVNSSLELYLEKVKNTIREFSKRGRLRYSVDTKFLRFLQRRLGDKFIYDYENGKTLTIYWQI